MCFGHPFTKMLTKKISNQDCFHFHLQLWYMFLWIELHRNLKIPQAHGSISFYFATLSLLSFSFLILLMLENSSIFRLLIPKHKAEFAIAKACTWSSFFCLLVKAVLPVAQSPLDCGGVCEWWLGAQPGCSASSPLIQILSTPPVTLPWDLWDLQSDLRSNLYITIRKSNKWHDCDTISFLSAGFSVKFGYAIWEIQDLHCVPQTFPERFIRCHWREFVVHFLLYISWFTGACIECEDSNDTQRSSVPRSNLLWLYFSHYIIAQ